MPTLLKDFTYKRGKLHVEYKKGRRLWQEQYIGPKDLRQGDPELTAEHNWKVINLWYVKRGDGYVFSKEWWRVCLGKSWFAIRRSPFIFRLSRYTRKYDLYFRWN